MPRTSPITEQEAKGRPRSSGSSINRVILVGNLTRDAELIATQGKPMARLRIATSTSWRDREGNRREASEFHSVVAFGRLAEVAEAHCIKGRRVYVEGRLRTRDYTVASGERRFSTEVVADTIKLLSPGGGGGSTRSDSDEADQPVTADAPSGEAETPYKYRFFGKARKDGQKCMQKR